MMKAILIGTAFTVMTLSSVFGQQVNSLDDARKFEPKLTSPQSSPLSVQRSEAKTQSIADIPMTSEFRVNHSAVPMNPQPSTAAPPLQTLQTLWLRNTGSWYWNFISYSSDSHAYVTDAQDGGNAVSVDRIEAFIRHQSCYGPEHKAAANAAHTHAYLRIGGVAVCKTNICTWACAEKAGYGRWCTRESCF